MVVCKKGGCRKKARWPSTFCTTHNIAEDRPPKTAVEVPPKQAQKKQAGFVGTFVFNNEDVIRAISKGIDGEMNQKVATTGYRKFAQINAEIEPMLELIVKQAGEQTSFPLKNSTRIQESILVVAPWDGSSLNWWTKGLIHQDYASLDVLGIYTFMLCLDNVTPDNGSIKIWKESKMSHHDPKNPGQGIEGLVATTLLGTKNTVFIWDARLLHQSLPNKTSHARRVIVWMVSSKTKPGIIVIE